MRKLHLSIESLQVESFATDAARAGHGTVHGASIIEPTGYTYCIPCGGGGDDTYGCTEENHMTCSNRPADPCGPKTE